MKWFCKLCLCIFSVISLISCLEVSDGSISGPLALRYDEEVYSHPLISARYELDDIIIDNELTVYYQNETDLNNNKLKKFSITKSNFDKLFDEPYISTHTNESYSGFSKGYSIRSIKNEINCSYKIETENFKFYFLFTNNDVCYIAFITEIVLAVQKSIVVKENAEYKVTFNNEDIKIYSSIKMKMELCRNYQLKIKIPLYKSTQKVVQNINFDYDSSYFDISYDSFNSSYYLYKIFPKALIKSSIIKISFEQFEWIIDSEVEDYNFKDRNIKPISSFEDINIYPEVQTLINSIAYYNDMDSYAKIDINECYFYDGYGRFTMEFYNDEKESFEYNLDYLSYLYDSVYYPTNFPMVLENPVGHRSFEIYFEDENIIEKDTEQSLIPMYRIGFGVIDPCCSGPQNPCHNLSFTAIAKNYNSSSDELNGQISSLLNDQYYLLKDYYPNYYLKYSVNEIDVYILKTNYGVEAHFEDNNYVYLISGIYSF